MKRSDVSLTIAFCLSLLLHGFGFVALMEKYNHALEGELVAVPLGIRDAGFEQPAVGSGATAYAYAVTGTPWVFSTSAGISGNRSDLTQANPPAPQGVQVAFIQRDGMISQWVNLGSGQYILSFSAAQRRSSPGNKQDLKVSIDGTAVGTFTPGTDGAYGRFETQAFDASTGPHLLRIQGLNSRGGDNTALIDALELRSVPETFLATAGRPVEMAEAAEAPAPEKPRPVVEPVHRPPAVEAPPFEELFGEKGGKGDALNTTAGDKPMQSRQADQVQAYVSHDPVPNPGPGEPSVAAPPGDGGNGGHPGMQGSPFRPEAAAKPQPITPQHDRAGSAAAAVAMLTRPTEDPAPLGLPPTAAPPPPMPPRPLRVVRPNMIAIVDPTRPAPPTTEEADKNPPTTQSLAEDEHSPTTAPVAIAPTTRPSVKIAMATPPTTAPTLDAATTQPSPPQFAANIPPVTTPPTTTPAGLPAPAPTTIPVADAPLKPPTTLPIMADARPKPPATQPNVSVVMAPPADTPPSPDDPLLHAAPAQPVPAPSPAPLLAPPPSPSMAATGGGVPGAPSAPSHPGGDGGNAGDTESDPFSKELNVAFVNGKVIARDGRHVKTFRPHLTDAGQLALLGMDKPMVILIAKIDETGKVVDVQIAKSSGSEEVDLPAYKCLWKWEFDPTRDKTGKAIPDVMIIPFVWR